MDIFTFNYYNKTTCATGKLSFLVIGRGEFVAVAWSVESLLSNPAARVRFPAGSGILISVLGIGCVSFDCVTSCVIFGGGPDIVLTTHSERPALEYLSSVLVQRLLLPLQALDPRAFGL